MGDGLRVGRAIGVATSGALGLGQGGQQALCNRQVGWRKHLGALQSALTSVWLLLFEPVFEQALQPVL